MLAYIKTPDLTYCPSADDVPLDGADYSAPRAPIIRNTYQYNGLMHQYPMAGVDNPARVVMLYEGHGKARLMGYSLPSPQLNNCGSDPTCSYKAKLTSGCSAEPGGTSGGTQGYGTYLLHNNGMNFTYADGHVKWVKLGGPNGPGGDSSVDPWAQYNERGIGTSSYWDGCHRCLFRPSVNTAATQNGCKL